MADFTPDDIIHAGKYELRRYSKFLPLFTAGLIILLALQTMIYSIGPEEVGVVQRFGRYLYTTGPGLHLKFPFGIDKVTPVKTERVFKEEFGFRTIQPGVQTRYSSQGYLDESLMLTGDLNILDVRWIVQFRVNDPVKLLFKTRDPIENIRDISEVVMRRL
jgi:membrane protease subunit HflK